MSLDSIGVQYRTDKSSLLHGYLEQYELLFPKPEAVTTVAEIGVQRGGKWRNNHSVPSLITFREWFYNAHVYGMDVKTIDCKDANITLLQGDQSKVSDLQAFAKAIRQADLIIDDGSHRPDDQLLSFLQLKDQVKPGGVYVIEDCKALITRQYKQTIHHLIGAYAGGFDLTWGYSNKTGNQSILFLRRRS